MALSRKPSQRSLAKMRLNFGNSSSKNVANDPVSEISEIVHLGGSRAGTPESIPSSNTADHRVTSWFTPAGPPPKPPVPMGLKRSNTEPVAQQRLPSPRSKLEYELSPVEDDRPVTTWFRPRALGPASPPNSAGLPPYEKAPLKSLPPRSIPSRSPNQLPSPLNPPPRSGSRSPRRLALASPASSSSISLSKQPRSPSSPYSSTSGSFPPGANTRQPLRRTQSHSEMRSHRPQSKALPPRPHEACYEHIAHQQAPERAAVGGARAYSPYTSPTTSPPLRAPLPLPAPITEEYKENYQNTQQQPASAFLKHSTQERLWLHKNYRGEVTFLKAWGLNFTKDEDRAEGLLLMRELIMAEGKTRKARKAEKETNVKPKSKSRSRSRDLVVELQSHNNNAMAVEESESSMAARAMDAILRSIEEDENLERSRLHHDAGGLQVIVEQEERPGLGMAMTQGDHADWRIHPVVDDEGMRTSWDIEEDGMEALAVPAPGSMQQSIKEHMRSESEGSILGAYLDIRMSRIG